MSFIEDNFYDRLRDQIKAGYRIEKAAEMIRRYAEIDGAPWSDEKTEALEKAKRRVVERLGYIEILDPLPVKRPDHVPWYMGPSENSRRWPALLKKMTANPRLSSSAVCEIDKQSTRTVAATNSPFSDFRTYGMVVGYIQSGKTANMTAVIAKAADAGIGLIVILAGMTDALRYQTQDRLISDLDLRDQHLWEMLTNLDDDYEQSAHGVLRPRAEITMVAVIKKNTAPMRKLLKSIKETSPNSLKSTPLLLIDDECDQASVNTRDRDEDPAAINGLIRNLLETVPHSHYIGYTATPFANVLINPEISTDREADLYPRDFILSLAKPEGYFGAEELFSPAAADEEDSPWQEIIIRIPSEHTNSLRPKSKAKSKSVEPTIPDSLRDALYYFVGAVAARTVRAEGVHQQSSMLVHVTHLTDQHDALGKLIKEWQKDTLSRLDNDAYSEVSRFREAWDSALRPRLTALSKLPVVPFDEIKKHLRDTLADIDVIIEHSKSNERLQLDSPQSDSTEKKKKSFIVIGGNVLARGVTLPGLITTYFLRSSGQYDSLMQAGRWFGFRQGYEDLPRIWMPDGLFNRFADLSRVEIELREEIAQYAARRVTPADVAVMIRQVPGLAITARNKMLHAEKCAISFYGRHIQTTKFKETDRGWLRQNVEAAAALIRAANRAGCDFGRPPEQSRGWLAARVPVELIIKFLEAYKVHEDHVDKRNDILIDYLNAENRRPSSNIELWNVGVFEPAESNKGSLAHHEFGLPGPVRRVVRSRLQRSAHSDADIRALMSKPDVCFDVPVSEIGQFKNQKDGMMARENWLEANGGVRPLLLLYVIDPVSQPVNRPSRLPLNAEEEVVGIGIVFPGIRDKETRPQN